MHIAFAHQKGGSGKTTSCINVAGYFALWGRRVLVVDLDSMGNATSGLEIDRNTLSDSRKTKNLKDAILETKSGVHVALHLSDGFDLKKGLEEVENYYDYILIDPPPSAVAEALALSDFAIVPLDGLFALEGLEGLAKTFQELDGAVKPGAVIFNKVRLFGNWSVGVDIEGFESVFPVPFSPKVHMSQVKGLPLSHLAPNSRVGRAYKKITQEVLRW